LTRFVLDASVVLAWCFEDEVKPLAELALDALRAGEASVPPIWPAEVGNALLVAERRGRAKPAGTTRSLELIRSLRIRIVEDGAGTDPSRLVAFARSHNLSTYDAAYLALALREGLPLATLDSELRKAARKTGVPLLGE
jgi:predicted nucleic acid-binding protein